MLRFTRRNRLLFGLHLRVGLGLPHFAFSFGFSGQAGGFYLRCNRFFVLCNVGMHRVLKIIRAFLHKLRKIWE